MRPLTAILFAGSLFAQDAREIVRRSVEKDQTNWRRATNYTWTARRVERRLDSTGKVTSTKSEAWETVILYGQPHRRFIERNGKPLSPDEARKEQQKLDKETGKLRDETPQQKQKRLADEEKRREKDRAYLLEMPDAFDLRVVREEAIQGRPVWVISANPKPGYRPRNSDAKVLLKVKGMLWIDKSEYQWVRVEAETIDTLSFGLFIARVAPGAKLIFEQTRVNDEIWLPKRSFVSANVRVVGKKLVADEEVTWSNFRKFSVESNIIVD